MLQKNGKNNTMTLDKFFKILNKKINKYNELAQNSYYTNPFAVNKRITISWVEDTKDEDLK